VSTDSTSPAVTREYKGKEIPQPGVYDLDAAHTHVGFFVRHLMVAKVRGSFTSFSGTITIAEDPLQSSVDVSIDTASIDTRDRDRDAHLRSADFFDVEQFPTMRFKSTSMAPARGNRWVVDGELTIRDVTQAVRLDVEFEGVAMDPWGGTRIAFEATTQIDREDFGLRWNQPLAAGGVLVGREITIDIEAEAVRRAEG
jgi:polyisoprenoid-binding protein YceI